MSGERHREECSSPLWFAGGFPSELIWVPQNGMEYVMKTTLDIPENELKDAMRFTGAKTKREAVVTALKDFNQRQRMAALTSISGSRTRS